MSANNSQGIYTQLPQSLSDSDSEHEINDLKVSHHHGHKLHRLHANGQHHGVQFTLPQHVVQRVEKKWTKGFWAMSLARRIAFVASILFCVLVIVVFLWVLPCSTHGTCVTKVGSWKVEHEGIELCGHISVINGRWKKSLNLALLAKKSLNSNYDGSSTSGAIALKTTTGQMRWFVPQVQTPSDMVCNLLDVNEDGVEDCLLLSEVGLQAIDALSGIVIWHGHNTKMIIANMDFPILLPDVNKDNVNELISVIDGCHNTQHNMLIVICGRTGSLLTSFTLHMCDDINNFKYDDKLVLFNCLNASHNNYYKIHVGDLQRKIANQTFPVQATKIQYVPQLEGDYILNGHKLEVQNIGDCPNCKTNIELIHLPTNKRLFGWSKPRMYAMKAIPYSFKQSHKNARYLKGHLNGFVMKLWQWTDAPSVSINDSHIKRNALLEKILLISFLDAEYQVINVSMVTITQLCFHNGLDCQPALMYRNDSLLLTDLDLDGAQELINYSSSYKCGVEDSTCHLVSRMEVVQLETEMPKLYAK